MSYRLTFAALPLLFAVSACGGDDSGSGDAATFSGDATNATASASATSPTSGDDDGSGDAPATSSGDDAATTNVGTSADSSGSDTNVDGPPACHYECTTPADCTANGMDAGFDCVAGRCAIPCASNETCVAALSFWMLEPCTQNGDCEFGKCMPFDGGGGCGFGPEDLACADVGLQAVSLPDITGTPVTVCAQPTATCDTDGSCFIGCVPGGCGALTCGADSKCVCDDDIQCYMAQLGEQCGPSGECSYACVTPADCPASAFDGTQTACL